ncbi:MAG: tryptophan synthase subunit alpha [Acidobacteriota bacterium]|nr:tryptophan synthase subunit alpha [Acidobacteriota bacterium]
MNQSQPTTRVAARFQKLRENGAKGLVVYLTAGDPSLDATGELLLALDRAGVDVIELGVPFSDPLADGPVIQRASERALRAGTTLRKILERFPSWRRSVQAPIILFSYFNPILQLGLEKFATTAAQAGVDGALVVDLTVEEAESYVRAMRERNLDTIFLASPTSTDARLEHAAQLSTGFLYLISRTGVTGERTEISSSGRLLTERARRLTSLPLAMGFGISTAAQVREVQSHADAAVVGSAVVHAIEKRFSHEGPAAIQEFVRELKSGTEVPPA